MVLISLNNFSKSFGSKKVFSRANFFVNRGEVLGVVGPSGSGKSVLIKIIIGFFLPDRGVLVNNSLSHSVGFSLQSNPLYDNLTVYQNLKYFGKVNNIPPKVIHSRISSLLGSLSLNDYSKVLVRNLSGGTKKRVDIACALITDPEVVVLDEPFLGLDPLLVNSLSEFILSLKGSGKTIIISSHRVPELSKVCSRMVLVKNNLIYDINKSQVLDAYS